MSKEIGQNSEDSYVAISLPTENAENYEECKGKTTKGSPAIKSASINRELSGLSENIIEEEKTHDSSSEAKEEKNENCQSVNGDKKRENHHSTSKWKRKPRPLIIPLIFEIC